MKKLFCKKTLSAFLAIVMTFAAMAGMFNVSAGAEVTAPTTLPDGNGVITDSIMLDASEKAAAASGSSAKKIEYKTFSDEVNDNWYNASGVLFYLDASEQTFNNLYFRITFEAGRGAYYVDGGGTSDDTKVATFQTHKSIYANDMPNTKLYMKADSASDWTEKTCSGQNFTLGKGFLGYVYIPFDNLVYYGYNSAGVTGFKSGACSFADGVNILKRDNTIALSRILIYHASYSAEPCTSISNFQFVYDDNFIDEASVTLTDDLSYNIYANVPAACTDAKVTFAMNGNTTEAIGVKQADGRYKYTLDGILPQFIGDDITATFTAKIGDKTVTDTYTTTLRKYCDAVLADTATEENTAILVKSLLHYGAEVQKYAGYKTSALCNEGIDAVTDVEITPNALANNDESVWLALGARLNGTITFKVKFAMPDGASKVTYSIGENAAVEATVEDGYVLIPVMAYQFAENITVQCVDAEGTSVGGSLVVSLNCYLSFMDEGNAADLAKAMINYGRAAEAVKKN